MVLFYISSLSCQVWGESPPGIPTIAVVMGSPSVSFLFLILLFQKWPRYDQKP